MRKGKGPKRGRRGVSCWRVAGETWAGLWGRCSSRLGADTKAGCQLSLASSHAFHRAGWRVFEHSRQYRDTRVNFSGNCSPREAPASSLCLAAERKLSVGQSPVGISCLLPAKVFSVQLRGCDSPRVSCERQGKSVIGLCQTNLSLPHGSKKSKMQNPGLLMCWLT